MYMYLHIQMEVTSAVKFIVLREISQSQTHTCIARTERMAMRVTVVLPNISPRNRSCARNRSHARATRVASGADAMRSGWIGSNSTRMSSLLAR